MSRCRFLFDECVPTALARGLQRRLPEVSVLQVGEPQAPVKGSNDVDLLRFCEGGRWLLITADGATIPDHVGAHLQDGRHTWGVLVVGSQMSLGQVLDELSLIHDASEDTDWIDTLYYLPLST